MVIGLMWVQYERVNPKPCPTHSAQESECAKGKAGCSRETNLIRGNLLEREFTPNKV